MLNVSNFWLSWILEAPLGAHHSTTHTRCDFLITSNIIARWSEVISIISTHTPFKKTKYATHPLNGLCNLPFCHKTRKIFLATESISIQKSLPPLLTPCDRLSAQLPAILLVYTQYKLYGTYEQALARAI